MLLIDVNVLVYAFREDAPDHLAYHRWLTDAVSSGEPFGLVDIVLSGFLRITTHPKVFTPPSPLDSALGFVESLRAQPNCLVVAPGPRHWEIFTELCRVTRAQGNFVPEEPPAEPCLSPAHSASPPVARQPKHSADRVRRNGIPASVTW